LVSSIGLADVVADAIGIARESAQLHLKTIRAAGKISFKGYGRSAAAMTALDASNLLLAAAGSTFAKDSVEVLKRFAGLMPLTSRKRYPETLEHFLAHRIEELPMQIPPLELISQSREWHQRFSAQERAETALQLLDPLPVGNRTEELPRYAIARWIDERGFGKTLVFGPTDDAPLKRGTEIHDLLHRYSAHRLFQVRLVQRATLIEVAAALKGIQVASGNGYGNTR
jgi:hypothetical protein